MIHNHEFDVETALDGTTEDIVAADMPMGDGQVAAKTISLANVVTIVGATCLCWGVIAVGVMALR